MLGWKKIESVIFPLRQIGKVYNAGQSRGRAVIHYGRAECDKQRKTQLGSNKN